MPLSGEDVSSSVLEIVELPDGEIVLKRADSEEEPLLNIRFSDESLAAMPQVRMEVAKAMIQAGIQAFAEMSEQVAVDEADFDEDADEEGEAAPHVLH
jgi:hypothetical protein